MTERSFYRWALLLPVAVTLLACVVIGVHYGLDYFPTSGIRWRILDFAQILAFAALFGAVPYAIVAIAISIWLKKPRTHYSRVLVLAPIAVIIVGEAVIVLLALATWNVKPMGSSYFYSVAAFIFGYAYVAMIWGAHKVATKAGWVVPGT